MTGLDTRLFSHANTVMELGGTAADVLVFENLAVTTYPQFRMPPADESYAVAHVEADEEAERWDGMS